MAREQVTFQQIFIFGWIILLGGYEFLYNQ